jgi:FAD:protein FMN transferase
MIRFSFAKKRPMFFLWSLFCVLIFSFGCSKGPDYGFYEKQKVLMGTVFEIKVFTDKQNVSKKKFEQAVNAAFDEVSRLENQMSEWIPDSQISQVAKYAGIKPVKISDDVIYVVQKALEVSRATNGAFDITFKPLGKLWNVGKRKIPPAKSEILKVKKLVDYKQIVLDPENKTLYLKRKGFSVGLGGVAKGYAAKKAGDVLKSFGLKNFMVSAGGDLYYEGDKEGEPWKVGTVSTGDGQKHIETTMEVKESGGLVTSGNYERYFEYKGKRYHHIIDTRTGYPAETGLVEVTVFCKNPTLADAYATSFFILGYEKSLKVIEKHPNVAFMMKTDSGKLLKSPNFKNFLDYKEETIYN